MRNQNYLSTTEEFFGELDRRLKDLDDLEKCRLFYRWAYQGVLRRLDDFPQDKSSIKSVFIRSLMGFLPTDLAPVRSLIGTQIDRLHWSADEIESFLSQRYLKLSISDLSGAELYLCLWYLEDQDN
jgi:hypothetical protein